MNPSKLLVLVSPFDRFSQKIYSKLAATMLRISGVRLIGAPLWISPKVYLDVSRRHAIQIGDRSVLSHYVKVLTHDFSMDRVAEFRGLLHPNEELFRFAPVVIGNYCFIGMGAMILPGVVIGDCCVVAAYSVVTRDVPAGKVVAGNPARVICDSVDFLEHSRAKFVIQRRRR